MELPVDSTSYKEEAYWDERFENEDSYDWFVGYEKIRDLMDITFRDKNIAQMKILILGETCSYKLILINPDLLVMSSLNH